MGYLFVAVFGLFAPRLAARGLSNSEQRVIWLSYLAHLLGAALQYLVVEYWYQGGDLLAYHRQGGLIARLLNYDFYAYGPEVVKLILGFPDPDTRFATVAVFAGTSTGSMFGIAAFLHYLFSGSLLASCALVAVMSFAGKSLIFHSLRNRLPPDLRIPVAVALMLVPSVVFWTSGMMKEAIATIGMGPFLYGIHALLRRRRVVGLVSVALGAVFVAVSKPYILSAMTVALAAAALSQTLDPQNVSTGRAFLGVIVTTLAVLLLGQLMPRYSIAGIGEELEKLQLVGSRITGGSNYLLTSQHTDSLAAQLALAPLALFTTLFRPSLIEVRNPLMLISALENAVLLILTYTALRRSGRRILRKLIEYPELVACAVFVVSFGTVVGLASTNLGTLSRYRVPMLPFFVVVTWVLARSSSKRVIDVGDVSPNKLGAKEPHDTLATGSPVSPP